MGRVLKQVAVFGISLMLVACSSAETRSLVSQADIPVTKYKKAIIFVENLDESERVVAEQIIMPALQGVGLQAVSAADFFKEKGKQSEQQKARIVQQEFDAVLYLKVIQKGTFEELVPGVQNNNGVLVYSVPFLTIATDIGSNLYDLKPDGSVYKVMFGLKAQVDLQDAKSAKEVWTSETIASGEVHTTNMTMLFTQTTNQIVGKLREDHVL